MPNTNASFSPESRSDHFRERIQKLEELGHAHADDTVWEKFDAETEKLLVETYGDSHRFVESYKYAILGEAEVLVNLPESAQEPPSQDLPQKAFQQRRQVLQAVLSEREKLEKVEEEVLMGEDHEDPPLT